MMAVAPALAAPIPAGGGTTPLKGTQQNRSGCRGQSALVSVGGRWLEEPRVGSACSGESPAGGSG